MNAKNRYQVMDDISRERVNPHLNLMPGIQAKINQRRQSTIRLRLAVLALTLVLFVTIISQPTVASALQKLIGFIPGIGVVDQSVPLRVLAAPVSNAYDGYTVFVDNAVLDARRTVLNVRIHGAFSTWEDPSQKPRMCQEPAVLVLPDSTVLRQSQSVGSPSGSEYQWQMVFGAVPPGIEQAVLELPCLPELPAGEGPQNWQIPLAFIPAPPETTVFPVIERNESGSTDPAAPVPEEKMQEGLSLQGTATLDDGYFLQTELRWNYDPTYFEVQVYPDSIHLFDQAGNEQSIWQAGQEQTTAPAMDQSMILNLQTGPIHSTGKLQVVVDYIGMSMNSATAFSFDAGPDPQPGQTWQLNQDLDVNGYDLKVLQAEYIRPAADQPAMLLLYLEANQEVLMVTAMDTEHVIFGTAGSPNSEHVPFRAGWYYQGDFPTGTIQVEITTITIRKPGPWSLEWSPSGPVDAAAKPEVPITLEQGVCSDQASFSTALPAGLGGRVATMERNGEAYEIYVSDLDGGNRLLIGPGIFPDLSPDGRRVVYTGLDGGLHIHDLTRASDLLIPNTIQHGIYNNRSRWSPDGRLIAFERVTGHAADIYLVNADGSELRAVASSPDQEHMLGWSPDSRYMSYILSDAAGSSLEIIKLEDDTLQSSKPRQDRKLPEEWRSPSISPDGSRLFYITDRGLHLYTYIIDQSVLLLGNPSAYRMQIQPAWSPNGEWIALSYWETDASESPKLVLLQPDTCQVILLDWSPSGWLSSWIEK